MQVHFLDADPVRAAFLRTTNYGLTQSYLKSNKLSESTVFYRLLLLCFLNVVLISSKCTPKISGRNTDADFSFHVSESNTDADFSFHVNSARLPGNTNPCYSVATLTDFLGRQDISWHTFSKSNPVCKSAAYNHIHVVIPFYKQSNTGHNLPIRQLCRKAKLSKRSIYSMVIR